MNVTLRKASVLQNTITESIRGIAIKTDIALTEFHVSEAEIAQVATRLKTNLGRRDALNSVLFEIRRAVAEANHTSGVNRKLTEVAELEKQVQFYNELAGKDVRESAEVLAGKLEKLRTAEAKSRIYGYGDTVATSILTAEDLEGFKKIVADFKRLKQKLQDEILDINVRTNIVLNDQAVKTLRDEGLL